MVKREDIIIFLRGGGEGPSVVHGSLTVMFPREIFFHRLGSKKLDENSVGDVVAWCGVDDIGKLGYEL